VLTIVPHRHHAVDDSKALIMAVEGVRSLWPGWERFLIASCGFLHLIVGLALAFAPYEQVYNAGTAPVYTLANRYVWAVAFAAAALSSALLASRRTTPRQLFWWFTAPILGGLWFTAFVLAVLDGRGSAIGVGVWFVLYGIFAVAALRIALGKR